jgi:TonB family protein
MLDLDLHKLGSVQNKIRFWTRKHGDIELQLSNFPSAWAQMNKCMSDLYSELGVVEADFARMTSEPEGDIFSFVGLPAQLTTLNFSLLYWVTPQGGVDACRLLQPSGVAEFDARVCGELMKKANFKPARNANGQPMRVPQYRNIRLRRQTFTTSSPL